jgi:hypothetical protein
MSARRHRQRPGSPADPGCSNCGATSRQRHSISSAVNPSARWTVPGDHHLLGPEQQ